MITLPPGFDYNALLSDLWGCFLPFVPVLCLFIAFRTIRKAMGRV